MPEGSEVSNEQRKEEIVLRYKLSKIRTLELGKIIQSVLRIPAPYYKQDRVDKIFTSMKQGNEADRLKNAINEAFKIESLPKPAKVTPPPPTNENGQASKAPKVIPQPPIPVRVKFRELENFSLISPLVEPFLIDKLKITITFLLTEKELKKINKIDQNSQMTMCVLRFCKNNILSEDFHPPDSSMKILLNGFEIKPSPGGPTKFSKYLSLNNKLAVHPNLSCMSQGIYGGIFLYRTTVESRKMGIVPTYTLEKCSQIIKQMLEKNAEGDDVLFVKGGLVSLMDQLTLSRIKTPLRSTKCNHLDCTEYDSILNVYPNCLHDDKTQINCLVCNQNLTIKDFYVDSFMQSVLVRFQNSESVYLLVNAEGNLDVILKDPVAKEQLVEEITDEEYAAVPEISSDSSSDDVIIIDD